MSQMSPKRHITSLADLAAQLADIRAQVKAQGGFVGDRDLHQCPACGLMEDVLYGGKLVTYWRLGPDSVDTGLRFKEFGDEQLLCPSCGGVSMVMDSFDE